MSAVFMIAAALASMAMQAIKGKDKGDNDPTVGKRYWSDDILAYATYGTNTAKLWWNQVFLNSEEVYSAVYLPMVGSVGQTYDIGAQDVNTSAVPGFSVEFPGTDMPLNFFEQLDEKQRLCKIVEFTRAKGEKPKVPSHYPGVALMYLNQGFMGMNTASVGNYRAVMTMYPGTVYILRTQGPDYEPEDIWVRYRETADCGTTITLNPITILTDILLDRYNAEDIDWLNAADVGKRLIQEKPYMWFAMAIAPQSYEDVVKDIAKKASIALYRTYEGKVGFRLIGQDPPGGIETVPTVDTIHNVFESTVRKPSMDNAEIVNEAKATYLAARYTPEEFTPFEETPAGEILDLTLQDNKEAVLEAKQAVEDDGGLGELLVYRQAKRELNASKARLESQKEEYNDIQSTKDGHYLKGGVHAVNTASMVLTGVRSMKDYNLDFLSWPDDATAYLQNTLMLYEHPLAEGNFQTSFGFSHLGVGDLVKVKIYNEARGLDFQFIAEIGGKRILQFGEEKVEFTYKESGKYYGLAVGDPNTALDPGAIDATPENPPQDVTVPTDLLGVMISPLFRGFPAIALCADENSTKLDALNFHLTTDCVDGAKQPDSLLAQEAGYFPSVGEIITISNSPAFLHRNNAACTYGHEWFITVKFTPRYGAKLDEIYAILHGKINNFGGTPEKFFHKEHAGSNYFFAVHSDIEETGANSGVGFAFRAMNALVSKGEDAVYVDLSAIFAADLQPTPHKFKVGDQVVILPPTNQMYSYGYGAVPLPATFGHSSPLGEQAFNIKTVPVTNGKEWKWDSSLCDVIDLDTYWHTTTDFSVFGSNTKDVLPTAPSSVIYAENTDTIDVWIAAPDIRRLLENKEMMGILQAKRGCGPEPDILYQETPIENHSAESPGAAGLMTVVIEYRNRGTGVLLYSEKLHDNKWHHRAHIPDIYADFDTGTVIEVSVSVSYDIPTSALLEQPVHMIQKTIGGLEIRHA